MYKRQIVYLEIDTLDAEINSNDVFGTVEAVKTVSDLFMPVNGKVIEVNSSLEDNPEVVNDDPYGDGWIIKIEVPNPSDIDVRRKRLPSNYKELGLNTICASELKSNMVPILGNKGDVIFFDTNAAHCAGVVSEGFERHVIRFDFEVHGFNPRKSLFQRLFSTISSRLS